MRGARLVCLLSAEDHWAPGPVHDGTPRCQGCVKPAGRPCPTDGWFHGGSYLRMVEEQEAHWQGKCAYRPDKRGGWLRPEPVEERRA